MLYSSFGRLNSLIFSVGVPQISSRGTEIVHLVICVYLVPCKFSTLTPNICSRPGDEDLWGITSPTQYQLKIYSPLDCLLFGLKASLKLNILPSMHLHHWQSKRDLQNISKSHFIYTVEYSFNRCFFAKDLNSSLKIYCAPRKKCERYPEQAGQEGKNKELNYFEFFRSKVVCKYSEKAVLLKCLAASNKD